MYPQDKNHFSAKKSFLPKKLQFFMSNEVGRILRKMFFVRFLKTVYSKVSLFEKVRPI